MTKRFSLITEYTEMELKELIAECVQNILQPTLLQFSNQINNSKIKCADDNKLLSRKEVCQLLKISSYTLILLQKQGKIKTIIVGGNYRYSKRSIDDFINKGNNDILKRA